MINKIINWNKCRIQKNYEKIIRRKSFENQDYIRKGRNAFLTPLSKEDFEDKTNLITELVSKKVMIYDQVDLFGLIPYDSNINYWQRLGELETDIMLCFPPMRLGPDFSQVSIGYPAKIIGGTTNKELLNTTPYSKIGGDICTLIKKLEERNLIQKNN